MAIFILNSFRTETLPHKLPVKVGVSSSHGRVATDFTVWTSLLDQSNGIITDEQYSVDLKC